MAGEESLTPNDYVVLALIGEQPIHGWAIASQLGPGSELGSVWALSRPVVYHGLDRLERGRLIRATGIERGGRGPHRVIYETTLHGRKVLRSWLAEPVERIREIRSLFVVKVLLTQRAGVDPEPLLVGQRGLLVPVAALLETQLDESGGASPPERTLLSFRLESVSSMLHLIDGLLDGLDAA